MYFKPLNNIIVTWMPDCPGYHSIQNASHTTVEQTERDASRHGSDNRELIETGEWQWDWITKGREDKFNCNVFPLGCLETTLDSPMSLTSRGTTADGENDKGINYRINYINYRNGRWCYCLESQSDRNPIQVHTGTWQKTKSFEDNICSKSQ